MYVKLLELKSSVEDKVNKVYFNPFTGKLLSNFKVTANHCSTHASNS